MSPTNDEIVIVKANELLVELEQQIRDYQSAKNILSATSQSTEELKNEYQISKDKLDAAIELASKSFAGIQVIVKQFTGLKRSLAALESTYKETSSQVKESQAELNAANQNLIESSKGITDKIVDGFSETIGSKMETLESNLLTKRTSDSQDIKTLLETIFGEVNKSLSMLNGISSTQSKFNPTSELKLIHQSLAGMSEEIGKSQNLLNGLHRSASSSKSKIDAWSMFIGAIKFIFVPVAVMVFLLMQLSPVNMAINRIRVDLSQIKSSQQAVMKNLNSIQLEEVKKVKNSEPSIQILNGCGIPQVAKKLEEQLSTRGYHIGNTENAANFEYKESIIITNSIHFSDGVRLALMMGIKADNVSVDDSQKKKYDFTVIIGADYQLINVD